MGVTRILLGLLSFAILGGAAAAEPAATLEQVQGTVKVDGQAAIRGQAVEPGAEVTTGADSLAVLRFRDGQTVGLMADSALRIKSYQYNSANAASSRLAVELVRGGMRYISPAVASQAPNRVIVESDAATLTTAGGDFIVVTGSIYLSVARGIVTATNDAGSLSFTAGQTAYIASAASLPAGINVAQIPARLNAAFGQLGQIQAPFAVASGSTGTAGAGTGAGGAGGMLPAGVSTTWIAVGVGVAAALAAAAGGGSTTPSHTTPPQH